jgi:hypothetical protein
LSALATHPHVHLIYVDREEPIPLSAVSCGEYTGLRAGGGGGVEPVQHPEIRYGDFAVVAVKQKDVSNAVAIVLIVRRTRTGDRPACACQWVVDDEVWHGACTRPVPRVEKDEATAAVGDARVLVDGEAAATRRAGTCDRRWCGCGTGRRRLEEGPAFVATVGDDAAPPLADARRA